MITENEPMSEINSIPYVVNAKYKVTVNKNINKIINKLKVRRDCLIYRNPTFDADNEDEFCRYVHNDVGFEVSQNEINLNIELDKEDICKCEALYFFNFFNKCLKERYNKSEFCSIMSLDNMNNWIFRFHIYRGTDNMWIDKNINNYREPLLYEIF